MSLAGLCPMADLCKSLRWNGRSLVCGSDYSKINEVEFKTAYFFGDKHAHNLMEVKDDGRNRNCHIIDGIAFHRGGKHAIDLIRTEDDFVKNIWFISSHRIDGKTLSKDGWAVSHLTEEQLFSFDYSETMARFKAVDEMYDRGMKGRFNGLSPRGTPMYYKFRTSSMSRQVIKPDPIYIPADPFVTPTVDENKMIDNLTESVNIYGRYLKYL